MAQTSSQSNPTPLVTRLDARVIRHDPVYGLSTLFFADGELRVPLVAAPSMPACGSDRRPRRFHRLVAPDGRVDHQSNPRNDRNRRAADAALCPRRAGSGLHKSCGAGDDGVGRAART